jgi:protein-disulfide isomerase
VTAAAADPAAARARDDERCLRDDYEACFRLGTAWYVERGGAKDDGQAAHYLALACRGGLARACDLIEAGTRPDPEQVYAVAIDDAPARGAAPARVTMVLATEFSCKHCRTVYPVIEDLLRAYPKDLRLIFRHFVVYPQKATYAARAACAAHRQGRFWPMVDLLWKASQSDDLSLDRVDRLAAELGLDPRQLASDVDGACADRVDRDQAALRVFGVRGTPSFFINGRFLSGSRPIEQFRTLIDEELAKANHRIAQGTSVADYYDRWVLAEGADAVASTIRPAGGRALLESTCLEGQPGSAAACYHLAEMWASGIGGAHDPHRADELYYLACQRGDARGCPQPGDSP